MVEAFQVAEAFQAEEVCASLVGVDIVVVSLSVEYHLAMIVMMAAINSDLFAELIVGCGWENWSAAFDLLAKINFIVFILHIKSARFFLPSVLVVSIANHASVDAVYLEPSDSLIA